MAEGGFSIVINTAQDRKPIRIRDPGRSVTRLRTAAPRSAVLSLDGPIDRGAGNVEQFGELGR